MMRVKVKTTDENRNTTTTLTDDSELVVALEASSTYFIDSVLTFKAGATPDFKYAFVYTGTISNALTFEGTRESSTTATGGAGDNFGPAYNLGGANFTTPTVRARSGSATAEHVGGGHIRGVLITNSAGDLKIQWAQNTSDAANITLEAGSYIAIAKQEDMDGTLIIKASDTSRATDTTLTADPDLHFPTKAGSKYIYELHSVFYSTSITPDFKHALHDAQASQALAHINNVVAEATGTFETSTQATIHGQFQNATFVTTPTSGTYPTSTTTDKNATHIHASHINGGTDNSLDYEWAQATSSATATLVVAPSWMLYEEVFQ